VIRVVTILATVILEAAILATVFRALPARRPQPAQKRGAAVCGRCSTFDLTFIDAYRNLHTFTMRLPGRPCSAWRRPKRSPCSSGEMIMSRCLERILVQLIFSTAHGGEKMLRA
jgi:hypothetical protein